MPDTIELDELLTGIRRAIENGWPEHSIEVIKDLMNVPWIHQWFGDDD